MAPFSATIRRAKPEEAGTISNLALRSKGHWGYDPAFLEACRDDLTISPKEIATSPVFVLEGEQGIEGFYTLDVRDDGVAVLDDLFVAPEAIGAGVGRRLWRHAVALAAALGCTEMELTSDPHAEGFYRAMGARRVGERESTVTPGRTLPLLRYALIRELGVGSREYESSSREEANNQEPIADS
jgi:GNAT superfamily N-acetyltransferase